MSDDSLRTEDYPITFGSLNINTGIGTDGVRDPDADKSCYRITSFDWSRLQYRDQREGLHLMDGGDLGAANRVFRYLSIVGLMRDTTPALLADRRARLFRAFDLGESQFTSPTTLGQQSLHFYTPTAVAPSGFMSPVHEMYYARPSVFPQAYDRINTGLQEAFAVELVCGDPTRYLYSEITKTASSSNSWSVAVPNWDEDMGAMTYPVVRITTNSGAHSASVGLRFAGTTYGSTQTVTLDLSDSDFDGSHTIDIDMRTKMIVLDGNIDSLTRVITGGSERAECRSSAIDTYWGIPANGGTFTVSSGTSNISSVKVVYRQART